MRLLLAILISCTLLFSQVDSLTTIQDTVKVSEEELFLKKISDEALAKEEKKERITNRVLVTLVVILLVDKFID